MFVSGFEKVLLALQWIFCAYSHCPLWVGKLVYYRASYTVDVALSIHWAHTLGLLLDRSSSDHSVSDCGLS